MLYVNGLPLAVLELEKINAVRTTLAASDGPNDDARPTSDQALETDPVHAP